MDCSRESVRGGLVGGRQRRQDALRSLPNVQTPLNEIATSPNEHVAHKRCSLHYRPRSRYRTCSSGLWSIICIKACNSKVLIQENGTYACRIAGVSPLQDWTSFLDVEHIPWSSSNNFLPSYLTLVNKSWAIQLALFMLTTLQSHQENLYL